jgi:myosin heavy subunit
VGFDYDKIQHRNDEGGTFWTAYSDLFTVLSIIFLLLYVVASVRSGTQGIQKQIEFQKMTQKSQDLEQQLRVYNTLRDEQMASASEREQEQYENLMEKLNLLQSDAKQERDDLMQQAKENDQKAVALNQYQQMIRNIINANVLAKRQLKQRDTLIVKKQGQLKDRDSQIANLANELDDNKARMNQIDRELQAQIRKATAQQKRAKTSKKLLEKRIAALRARSKKELTELEQRNQQVAQELSSVQAALQTTNQELEQTASNLTATQRQAESIKRQKEAEIAQKEQQLAAAKQREGKYVSSIQGLSGDLKKARETLEARQKLSKQIQNNFKKAGIQAAVDEKTGEVTLSFGDDYFETGSSNLKPSMRTRLEKMIPEYTRALFSDPKTAAKLANVEIVGFASSTYKGKFVNPTSLKPEDRDAIDYNLKLSFSRANSIFKHIFDPNRLQYEHQKELLPMVKVVGRGYLPDGKAASEVQSGIPEDEFCQKYNCRKAQRVIIKFNLKD